MYAATIGKYLPPPPGMRSPFEWGTEQRLQELFGDGVSAIRHIRRSQPFRYPSVEFAVEYFRAWYGPAHAAFARLDPTMREPLHADMTAVWNDYNRAQDGSLVAFGDYLETVAVKASSPSATTWRPSPSRHWVVNGYVLVYATLLITGGRLGDVLGSRRMLLGGLVLFTVASALCGVSGTATELVLARILQGVGAAVMVPQVITIISGIFPAERRGAAFGILSATAGVAAVSGPVLGGLIVTDWSWRWVFYINVPVCAVTCALVLIFVPAPPMTRQHRFDALGIVLATAGLAAVTYGLIEGQRYDWGTITGFITIPEVIGVGVVALIAFAWWQNRHPEPLMPLTLFRYRSFSMATLINGVLYLTMYGVTLLVSLHLQSVAGLSALRAGLTYLPMAFAMGFLSVVAGRPTGSGRNASCRG